MWSDDEKIQEAVKALDEIGRRAHRKALEEGFIDEVCIKEACGRVFLSHDYSPVDCQRSGCLMRVPEVKRSTLFPITIFDARLRAL